MDIKFIELLINLVRKQPLSTLIHSIIRFKIRLFQRKIFFEKYFLYFSVLCVTKNDCQIKNIFSLTIKSLFNLRKIVSVFLIL